MFGFLNIYKPSGITSFDVIARLRKILKIKQIGHAGTLDPLAEGVLPIAIDKATRLLEYLADDKAYICSIEFGKVSETYDTEGEVVKFSDKKVCKSDVETALNVFVGEIEQTPPAFSAVHHNGKRLYELARKGEVPTDIKKRKVFISEIKLLDFDAGTQSAKIYVACSKGTYIRSIVNDLGQNLDCGAVMTGLVRTKAGNFQIDKAVKLSEIQSIQDAKNNLINPFYVLSYKNKELSDDEFTKVGHGQMIQNDLAGVDDEIIILTRENSLVAVALAKNNVISVKKVFI